MADVVQTAVGTLSGGNLVATFGSNVTSGNHIAVFITAGNGNINTVGDTRSTSYSLIDAVDDTGTTGERLASYIGELASGGANTVTITPSGGPFTDGALLVAELGGLVSGDAVGTRHATNTQAAPGTSANGVTCGPVTSLAGDLRLLCVFNVGALQTGNYTAGTGFTEVVESGNPGANILDGMLSKQVNASAGSQSATATSANNDRTISFLLSLQSSGGGGSDGGATPSGFGLTASIGTPTFLKSSTLSPSGFGLTASVGAPTISKTGGVNPTGFALTASLGTPSVVSGSVITPTGFGLTASLGTPSVRLSKTIIPSGFGLTASIGTFDIEVDTTITGIPGFGLTASVGTPTVSTVGATIVTASGFGLTASHGTPSIIKTGSITPSGFGLTASLGTPSFVKTSLATPTGFGLTAFLGAASVVTSGGVTLNPVGFSLSAVLGTPAVIASAAVAPNGFGLSALLGTPLVAANATETPSGFGLSALLGLALVSTSATAGAKGAITFNLTLTPRLTFDVSLRPPKT
jgi:hypothetical protein